MSVRRCGRWLVLLVIAATNLLSPAQAETLTEAWAIAVNVSHQVQASAEQRSAAEETLSAAQSARLPTWDNRGGYFALNHEVAYKTHGFDPLIPPISVPFLQGDFFAGLSLVTLPLYTSGRLRSTIDAAAAGVDAAAADQARAVLDLKMSVAEAYIAVLYAQQITKVADTTVTNLEAHVTQTTELVKQAQRAKGDLLASQVQLADARQQALNAHNQLELARATYNRLLGRCLSDPVDLEEPAPEAYSDDEPALICQALAQRPELAALAHQQQGLSHQADAVRAEAKPQVGLSGGFAYLKDEYLAHDNFWVAGVAVKWDLDCGITKHRAHALDHQASAVSAQRAELETLIALQVRQARLDVQTTRERIAVTRLAIDQSDENLRGARDRYNNALGTNTEVLDALTLRTRTFGNYYNAMYNAVLAMLRLRRAVGDL